MHTIPDRPHSPTVRTGAGGPPPSAARAETHDCAQAYGRLTEGLHLTGYSFERACSNLEWLLQDDRWQRCGQFKDVNAFLDSVRLDQFRAAAEARKRIAERIKELQPETTNRQIARTLGVGSSTIDRDVAPNGATPPRKPSESANSDGETAPNGALSGAEVASLARREEQRLAEGGGPRPDAAALRGQPSRDGPDFWPTPHSLTTALVRFVLPDLPPGPIWECAAGDGRLVKALRAVGRSVLATDLYPQDGSTARDFLIAEPPQNVGQAIIITNPPFNQTDAFLTRGLALLDSGQVSGLVLLLRHDHLMAATRTSELNRASREVHCNWRPIWIDDSEGNPRWSFHWVTWWHHGSRQPPLYLSEQEMAE